MKISIDLDSNNVTALLRSVKKALALGVDVYRVEISSSGKGFHIVGKIESDNENEALAIRALCGDDARRIRYSLCRNYLGGALDICFDWKQGRRSRLLALPMGAIKKTGILKIKEGSKLVEQVQAIVAPALKKSFMTIFELNDDKIDEANIILPGIAEKDDSFRYKIASNTLPKGHTKFVGIIFSPDKNIAHKRGCWLKDKSGIVYKKLYWVKESSVK